MTRAGQAGIPGERRARKIEGQFVPRLVEMMESPAYRVLSLSARRCLDRIEIEHMRHGGRANGQLPITYEHFVEYGLHRHAIGPALRELQALGFIQITERGVAGNASHRAPNKFRLTYIAEGRARPTHEWRRIKSVEEAELVAKAARLGTNETPRKYRVQKQKPVPVSANRQCRIPSPKRTNQDRKTSRSPVPDSITTSRFSEGSRQQRARKPAWSVPVLKQVYPGSPTIVHLKSLYRSQAELAGDPNDVWVPPSSPIARLGTVGAVLPGMAAQPRSGVAATEGLETSADRASGLMAERGRSHIDD
jgi:hypothetical protein